jgi:hypothetical protein
MSVSAAVRKLRDTLTGQVTLSLLTRDGPVALDSPRWPVSVLYERRTNRPGDGVWTVAWDDGPTVAQMREHVDRLAHVITVGYGHPLRAVAFALRRMVTEPMLALALDRRILAGIEPDLLAALATQPGAARAQAEYAAYDIDFSGVGTGQAAEYKALTGKALTGDGYGYDLAWLVPVLTARHSTAEPVTNSRDGRRCARCDGPLSGSADARARYCSPACRQAAWRASQPVTRPRNAACLVCGVPVPIAEAGRAGRRAAYCSPACRQRAYRDRTATRRGSE